MEIEDLPVYIEYNDDEILAVAKAEIVEKVKIPKPITYAGGYQAGWHKDDKEFGMVPSAGAFISLPRTEALARAFIKNNELEERYDYDLKEVVYVSPATGNTYYDAEGVLMEY